LNDSTPEPRPETGARPLEQDDLDGHTIEELSDYLDRGREPRDPSIEASPVAQHALAALSRLRTIAPRILEAEAKARPPRNDSWIKRILDQIGMQLTAGRDIPIRSDAPNATLSISEGAVRALVREVGDGLDGMIVERCRLEGDVGEPGAPVAVTVEISVFVGTDSTAVTRTLRLGVLDALATHTELNVTGVTITVRDTDLTEDEAQEN
jgi:hypothetical protein